MTKLFGIIGWAGISLDFKGSYLLLIILLLLALAWAVRAYWRTVPPVSLALRLLLGTLRALALTLIILLIFEPSLSLHRTYQVKPLLAVLIDDSQSLQVVDGSGSRIEQLKNCLRDPTWEELQRRFEIHYFAAGDSLHRIEPAQVDSLPFNTIGTDLTRAWQGVFNQPEGDLYAALVLLSDGGDNAGRRPTQAAEESRAPIFTVGLGDTAVVKDASISSVFSNETAYRGKEAQIVVKIKAQDLAGQRGILELSEASGAVLASTNFVLPQTDLEAELVLKFAPQQVGLRALNLRLVTHAQEFSLENNLRSFPLEVRESRIKVFALVGQPGFESQFFIHTTKNLPDLELHSLTLRQDGRISNSESETALSQLNTANVLVFIGLTSQQNSAPNVERLRRAFATEPRPTWIWLNQQTDLATWQSWKLDIPVQMQRAAPAIALATPADFYAELNPDAEMAEAPLWQNLPPIQLPDKAARAQAGGKVLIKLKDGQSGADQGAALIIWESDGNRRAVLFGSGYWRWSFLTIGLEGSDEIYRQLLTRTLRWLASSPQNNPLQLSLDRTLYSSGEKVEVRARVTPVEGQAITSAQVDVIFQGPDDAEKLSLEPDASGNFAGQFYPQEVGRYVAQGVASAGADTLGTDSSGFLVELYNLEKETSNQNDELLQALAQASGGAYLGADSISSLTENIQASPRQVSQDWNRRFFLNWDLWGIVIGLLSVEWIIRRRKGML